MKSWRVNVGRGACSWEVFELAHKIEIDILAMREDGQRNGERDALVRHVEKSPYRFYHAPRCSLRSVTWGGFHVLR